MFAELAAGGPVVKRRLNVQQQGQSGPIDLGLGRGMASDQALTRGYLVAREGRLIRRGRTSHATSPLNTADPPIAR